VIDVGFFALTSITVVKLQEMQEEAWNRYSPTDVRQDGFWLSG